MAQTPGQEYPIYPTYWRAWVAMLPALFRMPGVGVNAGAPPPDTRNDPRVTNFVSDVTSEILEVTT